MSSVKNLELPAKKKVEATEKAKDEFHVATVCGSMSGKIPGPPENWPECVHDLPFGTTDPRLCKKCKDSVERQPSR